MKNNQNMKVGILGAGSIAHVMARTICQMEGVELSAVGSRSLDKAREFARQYNIPKAYGSYEELVRNEETELIYVASLHSLHYEHTKLCLDHGKSVLCEKAFMMNSAEAEEVCALAKEKGLLLAEAIWTRYMPSRKMMRDIIESGVIGKVTSLTANLGYVGIHSERMTKKELGGGALLDLGVYPINFAMMAFGDDYETVTSTAVMTEEKVDFSNSVTLTWKDGRMAVLHSSIGVLTDRQGIIYGSEGYMIVHNINNCEGIDVYDKNRQLIRHYEVPKQISGYEYEVEACRKVLREGRKECQEMPHEVSIHVMKLLDEIRNLW